MAKYTFIEGHIIAYNARDETYLLWSLSDLSTFGLSEKVVFKSKDLLQIYKRLEMLDVRVIPERFLATNRLVDYFSSILS